MHATQLARAWPWHCLRLHADAERPIVGAVPLVRIECDAHGRTLGWIYAVANPYFTLTAEDGTFELREVPSGDYMLVANQAYTGPVEVDVTVTAA